MNSIAFKIYLDIALKWPVVVLNNLQDPATRNRGAVQAAGAAVPFWLLPRKPLDLVLAYALAGTWVAAASY